MGELLERNNNFSKCYVCLLLGMQCLVIGEITCDHMVVVLNKIDLVGESKRETQIAKVTTGS